MLRYEDLVRDPQKEVASVYESLGVPLHENVIRSFEEGHVNSEKKRRKGLRDSPFGTFREDPLKVANAWKTEMNVTMKEIVKKHCGDVLTLFKYDGEND